jgi:hypothetical protein
MEDLIKAGADPRAVDYDGNTIFHDAISWNTQWPHVKTALEAVTAIGVQADTVNHQGRTILHIAAGLDDGVGKTDKVKSESDSQSDISFFLLFERLEASGRESRFSL